MADLAEVAHTLRDTVIVHLAGSFPLVVGGVVALASAVVAALAWLCYQEHVN